jgi:hypothetical protein
MTLEELMKKDIPDDTPLVILYNEEEYPVLQLHGHLTNFFYELDNTRRHAEWRFVVDKEPYEDDYEMVYSYDKKNKEETNWAKKMNEYLKSAPMTFSTLKYIMENKFNSKHDCMNDTDMHYERYDIEFDYARGKVLIYDSLSEWYMTPEMEKEFFESCLKVIDKVKYSEESVPKSLIENGFFAPSNEKGWLYPAELKTDFVSFTKDKYTEGGFYIDGYCSLIHDDGYGWEILQIDDILKNKYLDSFKRFVIDKCDMVILNNTEIYIERKYGEEKPEKIQLPMGEW